MNPNVKRVNIIHGITMNFNFPSTTYNPIIETWQTRLQTHETFIPAQKTADLPEQIYTFFMDTIHMYAGDDDQHEGNFTVHLGQVMLEVFWNMFSHSCDKMSQAAAGGLVNI